MTSRDHLLAGGVVVAVGVTVATVPVYDAATDILWQEQSLLSAVIENTPLLVLALGIAGTGVWLAFADWDGSHVRTVARITAGNAVGVALLIAVVVFVQWRLQSNLKPLVIAADAVVVGALGGLLLGLRSAQQERSADAAAAERDRFQALFENVPNPIVGVEFTESVPVVRAVNPAFTEVFGFDRRTILGDDLRDYIVPPEESLDPVERPMTAEEVDPTDSWDREIIELETVDGIREFVRLSAPVDRGPSRDGYAIYIDVTAQRQRQERLRVLSRTLRHDMRNHLNVVKGGAEGLTDELEGEAREWASLIEEAAAELLETSEQARRIEQQIAGDSNPGRVDLAAIVRDEAERLRASYDCTVTVDVPDEAPGCVTIGFRDAVRAVLENAVEHNDTDHPTVEAAVVESLDGGYYDVRIADDGPGIPADEAQVVREPSQRSQTQHLDGLGLWTARWVLQNSGGDLEFSSNAPRGTVVTLRVPRSDADAGDGADGCETDAAADPDGPADPATAADEPPATD